MPVVTEELKLPLREARAGKPEAWEALSARYRLALCAYDRRDQTNGSLRTAENHG